MPTEISSKQSQKAFRDRRSEGEFCRAFALEGTGIWHAATVSLAQQLWGPLRGRLDSRMALDTTAQVQTSPKLKNMLPAQNFSEKNAAKESETWPDITLTISKATGDPL